MRRHSISLIMLITGWATLMSCGDKKPEGILSKAEMVDVMEDIYLAEEKVNSLGLPRDSAKKVFEALKPKVFQSAGITDSLFRRSFDYYMEKPAQMEKIYTALVDTLQLREQRVTSRPEQP